MGQPIATNSRFENRTPELEQDFHRNAKLGYEPAHMRSFLHYLEHGAPNPLIRWHYHEEYELHLIVNTYGKVFVGDYIGSFEPGNLVLTGPNLPHNWISLDMPETGIKIRDKVIQFADQPLRQASELISPLREVLPLLERAKYGIEFIGISEEVEALMQRIKNTAGMPRLVEFMQLLIKLSTHDNYKLLSSAPLQSFDDKNAQNQISDIIEYITENYDATLTMAEVAERFNMSPSRFSRYFQRKSGNTFTDFVNRMRVNRACTLLMETDQYVSTICYAVGFNNIANFNRRFMEIKGMTPGDFRRQGQERFG
ncbi:MAG: AraC family transcriptional regulator [Thiolinea sp.]